MQIEFTQTNIHTLPTGAHSDTLSPLRLHVRNAILRPDGKKSDGGARVWQFQFQWQSKKDIAGLGAIQRKDGRGGKFTLQEAREEARRLKGLVNKGIYPKGVAAASGPVTFEQDMLAYHRAKSGGDSWSAKWAKNWLGTMERHVIPQIGKRATRSLSRQDIADTFAPLWASHNQTCTWAMGAVAAVIDKAMFSRPVEFEGRANPVAGVADHMLDEVKRETINHPSIPWEQAPSLYATLAAMDCLTARALMLLITTGTPRTDEIIGLRWGEVNLTDKVIVVPKERVKSRREHLLPLSDEAIRILIDLGANEPHDPMDFVFSGRAGRWAADGTWKPFSGRLQHDAMQFLLRETLHTEWHVHGLRSTWRSFVSEHNPTLAEDRATEFQLDHKIKDESNVRGRYDRALLLCERRKLLDDWCAYLTGTA